MPPSPSFRFRSITMRHFAVADVRAISSPLSLPLFLPFVMSIEGHTCFRRTHARAPLNPLCVVLSCTGIGYCYNRLVLKH